MDEFEKRLKSLPIHRPSPMLRRRIFGRGPEPSRWRGFIFRPIPLAWTAALMMAAGLAGYGAARLERPPTPAPATVSVRIIDSPVSRHVFDFGEQTSDFLPGELVVRMESQERNPL